MLSTGENPAIMNSGLSTSMANKPKSVRKTTRQKQVTWSSGNSNHSSFPRTSRWSSVTDVALALVLAAGLSTVFLSPVRQARPVPTPSVGKILGATISIPLSVPVTISVNGERNRFVTFPTHGHIAEALASAAGQAQSSMTYSSRGNSVYLESFLGYSNTITQAWVIACNGAPLLDLASRQLMQGDELSLTYLP